MPAVLALAVGFGVWFGSGSIAAAVVALVVAFLVFGGELMA